jgi:hypothetical protein
MLLGSPSAAGGSCSLFKTQETAKQREHKAKCYEQCTQPNNSGWKGAGWRNPATGKLVTCESMRVKRNDTPQKKDPVKKDDPVVPKKNTIAPSVRARDARFRAI